MRHFIFIFIYMNIRNRRMIYAFGVIANFLRAQPSDAVTGVCAVLSAVRPRNLSENPLRQRTLQRCFGEAGS